MIRRAIGKLLGLKDGECAQRDLQIDTMNADIRELERAVRDLRREILTLKGTEASPGVAGSFSGAASRIAEAPGAPVGKDEPQPAGGEYRGPVDNESARARAAGKTLVIDEAECIGCGTCIEYAETVFALKDDAKATVLTQDGPMDMVQATIEACPVTCIHWR